MCRNRINLNAELCNMNRETENSFPPTAFPAGGKVKRIYLGAFVLLFALFNPCLVLAQTTIDFENMPYLVDLNDQYSQLGVTFENGAVLTAYLSLNEVDFPPHSGSQAAGDSNGPLAVRFINAPAKSVSGWFTYSAQLTLSAYDNKGNLVNSVNSAQSSNYGTSEFISLTASPEIRTLIINSNPPGQHYIMDDFQFELISTCTITASAGSNGSISPSGNVEVAYGGSQQFAATPDPGYAVDTWSLDGVAVHTGGTTVMLSNIIANHTLSVTFKPETYTITASAGSNGSISPSGNIVVNYNSNQQFTATPATGYQVDTWFLDGSAVQTGGTTYTLSNITADHTVSVTFIVAYTITASADPNGSISPSGNVAVASGSNQQFTATPNAGFVVNTWSLDGTVVKTGGTTYTLSNITANHTVSVTFKTATYTITASVGSNGSISPSGNIVVNSGSNQQFTATPNTGYAVNTWSLDGVIVQTGGTTYTLYNITANHTVSVTFIATYIITTSTDGNGWISPPSSIVTSGDSRPFTAYPNTGYTVNTWSLDGVVVQTGGTTYTLYNITANHTISVTFKTATYTITASVGSNGSISPSGNIVVNYGSNQQFTATPNTGYAVNTWLRDGVVVQTGGITYTLNNIAANHTVSVTFIATYTITASADPNGSISPSGNVVVNSGSNKQFIATPNAGYAVNTWLLDGVVVQTGGTTYTLSNITANHTVSVTFKIVTYTITASAGSHGSISPSGSIVVNYRSSQQFIAMPDAGYAINTWSLDGVVVQTGGTTYTLSNITANHTVSVTFGVAAYTITASADTNGSISPSGNVSVTTGSSWQFTATPNAGYTINTWLLDGVVVQTSGMTYTLSNITANHTVSVTFIVSYTITVSADPNNGSISPSGNVAVASGRNQQFIATPNNFYSIDTWLLDGGVVQVGGTTYVLNNITSNHTLSVTFNIAVVQKWVARYNGPGNSGDISDHIALDNSGNVYVTGNSVGIGTYSDYATIKYDTSGNQLWVARYDGPVNATDSPEAIAVDISGNVYVTGYSTGDNANIADWATIKYDTNGNQKWVARYKDPEHYHAFAVAIAVDISGNVYVTGYDHSGEVTIKYDTDGNQIWIARYSGLYSSAMVLDSSGNVYVTGYSAGIGTNYTDYVTIKYDTNGNQKWVALYNGPGNYYDDVEAIALDSSGNVYVTGYSYGIGTNYDYATIKYDTNGNQKWVARYNGPQNGEDDARRIAVDSSGNVYVTGQSMGKGTNYDYTTVKYDTNGNQIWGARYNGDGNDWDEAFAITVDNLGNVYVTGQSMGKGTNYDYATVKYDPNGVQKWVARYNGPGSQDRAYFMALDNAGNVYVTGESDNSGTYSDYATIKYSQVSNNRPPVANAGPDQKVEQNSPDGAQVQLDGSASSDPDGDSLTYTWTWSGGSASGVNPVVTLPIGLTTVSLTVSDGKLTNTDTVDITVVAATYTITASAGSNGSINPSGDVVVNSGSNQQFTATPATGYQVDTWLLDGTAVQTGGTSYTLNSVTAAHTVSVTFELLTYTITASAGTNGSISPSGAITVNYAANQQFTATPATGYQVDTWLLDGSAVQTGGTSYTLNSVTAAHTVSVTFELLTYTITASAGTNGSISPSGAITVNYATNQQFTATPATGYQVDTWLLDGTAVQTGGTSYTLNSVTATHTVSVTFKIANNRPPVANAGYDQTAYAWIDGIAEVNLDGSGSYDNDSRPLTYLWSWTIDGNDYEANCVKPTIELPVGQYAISLIVNDGLIDSDPNEVNITVIGPIEVNLFVMPKVLNTCLPGQSNIFQQKIMTTLRLPKGITKDQIDTSEPILLYPGEIKADKVLISQDFDKKCRAWNTAIFASFDKDELMDAIDDNGQVELAVVGQLKTGQYFFGTDNVRVICPGNWPWHRPWCDHRWNRWCKKPFSCRH